MSFILRNYRFTFVFLCFIFLNKMFAQCDLRSSSKEVYQWRFFQETGLDFNNITDGKPEVVSSELVGTPGEGSASIADDDGNLVFYTDGIDVYDQNDDIVPNGTGLFGNPSATSSAIIFPNPSDPNKYYIATVDEGDDGPLYYSEFDKTIGATGGIVAATKNTLVTNFNIYEKVGAVAHSNGSDTWVIVTEAESNNYHSFHFGENGVINTVVNTVGPAFDDYDDDFGKGYIKPSVDGSQLIIASADEDPRGFVEVFEFDNETGVISSYPTPKLANLNAPYGVEISPNGRYLYVSQRDKFPEGSEKKIYQFDLEANDFAASRVEIGTMKQGGALQIGPDGMIYASQAKQGYIGRIEAPNLPGTASNFDDEAIYLNGKNSGEGLPTFVTSFFNQAVDAGPSAHICEEESVDLGGAPTAQGGAEPYTYSWTPNTGLSADNVSNPTATPSTTTTYVLTVTDDLGCTNTDKVKITVNPLPEVDAGQDITTCEGGIVSIGGAPSAQGGTGPLSVLWSPSTGLDADFIQNPTLTVSGSVPTYTLTVTDSVGCLATSSINVNTEERITLDAIIDNTSCAENSGSIDLQTSGSSIGPFSYEWQSSSLQTLELEMDQHLSLEATYLPDNPTYSLTINIEGLGLVMAPKNLIFNPGDVVEVSAFPYEDYYFLNWSDDLTGSEIQESIVMNSDKVITAHFGTDFAGSTVRYEAEGDFWNLNEKLDDDCDDNYGTFKSQGEDKIDFGNASEGLVAYPSGGDWRAHWWVYDGPAGNFDLDLRWYDLSNDTDDDAEVLFRIGRRNASCVHPPNATGEYKLMDDWHTSDYQEGWYVNSYSDVFVEPGDSIMIYQLRTNSDGIALIDYIDFHEAPVKLSTNVNGNGSINSSPGGNLFPFNTSINLSAQAELGWLFDNWTGDFTGTNQLLNLTLLEHAAVVANFSEVPAGNYALYTSSSDYGSVTPNDGQYVHTPGETVEIEATPEAGYSFHAWRTNLTNMKGLAAGDYIVSVEDADGCNVEKTFTVGLEFGELAIELDDVSTSCFGDTVHLSGNNIEPGQKSYWYIDGILSDSLMSELDTSNLSVGTHQIVYSLVQDECGEAFDTIEVNIIEQPVADILSYDMGDTIEISENNIVLQHVVTTQTGSWTFNDLQSSGASHIESSNEISISDLVENAFIQIEWEVIDNNSICPAAKDSVYIVLRSGTIPDAGSDSTICVSNLPFTRLGNGNETNPDYETFKWIDLSTNSELTTNELSVNNTYIPGSYQFMFEINHSLSGVKRDTFTLNIIAENSANISSYEAGDTIETSEDNLTLYGLSSAKVIWSVDDAGLTLISSDDELSVSGLLTDEYVNVKLEGRDSNNVCAVATDSVVVVRRDGTVPDAGNDTTICVNSLPFSRLGNGVETDPDFETFKWVDIENNLTYNTNELHLDDSYLPGTYQFVFEITHSLSGIQRDTFSLEIIDLSFADILEQQTADTLTINVASQTFEGNQTSNQRVGNWQVESDFSIDITKIEEQINIDNVQYNDFIFVKWSVEDIDVICPLAVDSLWFVRYDITPAMANNDTICFESSITHQLSPITLPDINKGEEAHWLAKNDLALNTTFTELDQDIYVDVDQSGEYLFEYIISNSHLSDGSGGTVSSSVLVSLFVDQGIGTFSAGEDQVICSSSTSLDATLLPSGFSGLWISNDDVVFDQNDMSKTSVSNISDTNTISWLVWSDLGKCPTDTASLQVISLNNLTTPILGDDQVLCVSDLPLTISGNEIKEHEFTEWAGTGILSSLSDSSIEIGGLIGGDYTFTYSIWNSACAPATDQITITVIDTLSVNLIASNTSICSTTEELWMTASGSPGTGQWYFNHEPQDKFNFNGESTLILNSSLETGTWHFEITNETCPTTKSEELHIAIYDKPLADLDEDFEVFKGEEITIIGSSSTGIFEWIESPYLYSNNENETAYIREQPEGSEIYSFIAINGECRDTAHIVGTVKLPISVPPIFTPNGDDIHDTWEIEGLESDAIIKIFNRWGGLVFESTGYNTAWGGLAPSGNKVPDATYYYIIESGEENFEGNVTVIR